MICSIHIIYVNQYLHISIDNRTCNGAIPHPYLPILGTYGIDSDVKLWAFETPNEDSTGSNYTSYYSIYVYIYVYSRVCMNVDI